MGLFKKRKKRAFSINYYWCGKNTNIVIAYNAEQAIRKIRRITVQHVQILDVKELEDFPL